MVRTKFYLKKILPVRYFLPGAVFILTVALILKLEYPLEPASYLLVYLSRLDPLTFLAYLGATRTIPDWFLAPFFILLLTAFYGRFFCNFLCPLGGMFALLERAYRALPLKNAWKRFGAPQIFRAFSKLRYFWLAAVLLLLAAGMSLPLLFTPLALISHEISRLYWGQIPWILGTVIFLGMIFFPHFWCLYLCPSGLLFSLAARFSPLKPTAGCLTGKSAPVCQDALCQQACPVRATAPKNSRTVDTDCFSCGDCLAACPRGLIKWRQTSPKIPPQQGRRNFLFALTTTAAILFSPFSPKIFAAAAPPILRPPGALKEELFLASCVRCGRCIKVCPSECLVPMTAENGLLYLETPQFIPRKARCELCMLCPKVCAHGALEDIAETEVKIGKAVLDENTCLAFTEGKLCLVCAEQCPSQAVLIDEHHRPSIDVAKCTGCGACENVCPLEDSAVIIKPELEQ
ncbi:MAG: 4Fe-4S binding protein [Sporomusaceae bacterium]|jgi:ferredoxin|nr:4Fe-4S binding protein [Sporomusaceae bacterium]